MYQEASSIVAHLTTVFKPMQVPAVEKYEGITHLLHL